MTILLFIVKIGPISLINKQVDLHLFVCYVLDGLIVRPILCYLVSTYSILYAILIQHTILVTFTTNFVFIVTTYSVFKYDVGVL